MKQLRVEASKSYDILIESGLLDRAGDLTRKACGGSRALIVCGDVVERLYTARAEASLRAAGYEVCRFVYPHGEQSKNAATYFELLNRMAECGLTRTDVVVALGGGVTGDLAGFAAATYMRGIKYVQIPTTVLAMVDSSVGGKTAIDLPAGKNLAGAFHPPSLVICDADLSETLPDDIFTDGLAEVIKYAVLREGAILELIKHPRANIEEIITRCVVIKRDIVNADEFDHGERQLLNLGHTVGHAVELLSDFKLSHGRAVSIGMAVVARAAAARGDCDNKTAAAVEAALKSLDLPTGSPFTAEELCGAMLRDKKRAGESISLIIPRRIGLCEIRKTPVSELCAYLGAGM